MFQTGLLLTLLLGGDARDAVIDAKDSLAKGRAYRSFFEATTLPELKSLLRDSDTGIALQAAWELARVPKRKARGPGRTDWTYDPRAVSEFLTAFKNRTHADVPEWWSKGVLDIDLFPGQHHAFVATLPPKYHKSVTDAFISEGVELTNDDGLLTFTKGALHVTPNDKLLRTNIMGAERVAAAFSGDAAFLAPHGYGSGGMFYQMACVDLRSGSTKWVVPLWAAGRMGIAGMGNHHVEVVSDSNQVVVYGMESHGAYAEAFDLKDGHVLFRFCTCYWFNFPEAWKVPWGQAHTS